MVYRSDSSPLECPQIRIIATQTALRPRIEAPRREQKVRTGCLKATLLNVDTVLENNTTMSTTAQLSAFRMKWPLERRYQRLARAGGSHGARKINRIGALRTQSQLRTSIADPDNKLPKGPKRLSREKASLPEQEWSGSREPIQPKGSK